MLEMSLLPVDMAKTAESKAVEQPSAFNKSEKQNNFSAEIERQMQADNRGKSNTRATEKAHDKSIPNQAVSDTNKPKAHSIAKNEPTKNEAISTDKKTVNETTNSTVANETTDSAELAADNASNAINEQEDKQQNTATKNNVDNKEQLADDQNVSVKEENTEILNSTADFSSANDFLNLLSAAGKLLVNDDDNKTALAEEETTDVDFFATAKTAKNTEQNLLLAQQNVKSSVDKSTENTVDSEEVLDSESNLSDEQITANLLNKLSSEQSVQQGKTTDKLTDSTTGTDKIVNAENIKLSENTDENNAESTSTQSKNVELKTADNTLSATETDLNEELLTKVHADKTDKKSAEQIVDQKNEKTNNTTNKITSEQNKSTEQQAGILITDVTKNTTNDENKTSNKLSAAVNSEVLEQTDKASVNTDSADVNNEALAAQQAETSKQTTATSDENNAAVVQNLAANNVESKKTSQTATTENDEPDTKVSTSTAAALSNTASAEQKSGEKNSSGQENKQINIEQANVLSAKESAEKQALKEINESVEKKVSLDEKSSENLLTSTHQQTPPPAENVTSGYASQINEAQLNASQVEALVSKEQIEGQQKIKLTQMQNNEIIAIHQKDFADNMKEKVMLMINQKLQQADIQLDPPELGNVSVRVHLQHDVATVSFIVQNNQAKEALDQQMHKLKEMMAQAGIDIGESQVQQQDKKSTSEQGNGHAGTSQFSGTDEEIVAEEQMSHTHVVKASPLGVDFYA